MLIAFASTVRLLKDRGFAGTKILVACAGLGIPVAGALVLTASGATSEVAAGRPCLALVMQTGNDIIASHDGERWLADDGSAVEIVKTTRLQILEGCSFE